MAKALYGHFATRETVLLWENDRLRARVAQLESEVERLSLELAASSVGMPVGMPLAETLAEVTGDRLRPALA